MTALILAFALLGHGWVWVAAVNWTHAVRMPKWLCNVLTLAEIPPGGFAGSTSMPQTGSRVGGVGAAVGAAGAVEFESMACGSGVARWRSIRIGFDAPRMSHPGCDRFGHERGGHSAAGGARNGDDGGFHGAEFKPKGDASALIRKRTVLRSPRHGISHMRATLEG